MSNWEKYYRQEDVRGFLEQEPYYSYCLECFAPYIELNRDRDTPLITVLGGIHPQATNPDEFAKFCHHLFPNSPIHPLVVDQNLAALTPLSPTETSLVQAKLEKLPIDHIDLLITDYTFDFMTDKALLELNQSIPRILSNNGLLIATIDNPFIPSLRRFIDRHFYGADTYPRTPQHLSRLLSNLKPVIIAVTGNQNQILIFSQKDAPINHFVGAPIGLFPNEGVYSDWLHTRRF